MSGEFAVFAEMDDLLDETLTVVVARMGLAGVDELHGTLLVADELHDIVELLEDQRRAFVSSEAAREADGQRVGREQMIEADVFAGRDALVLMEQFAAGKFD